MRIFAPILFAAALLPSLAHAEEAIGDLEALHAACRHSEQQGRRHLYVVDVPRVRFEDYLDDEGALLLDTRRNFRVLRGAAEIFPTNMESVGFVATAERAAELTRRGKKIRLGFFLAFDGGARACLIRHSVGVTMVRADLAFVELLDARGRVVAREDTERLRAWQDDLERDGIPGAGPRAAVLRPTSVRGGALTSTWSEPLTSPAVRSRLSACAAQRQHRGEAQVIVVLRVAPEGRVAEASTELSSLRDEGAEQCLLDALREIRFPVGNGQRIRAPIRLAD